MKTTAKYLFLLLISCLLIMTTCKKDNKEEGVLHVETYDATEVQGSSAILHGELISMSTPNLIEFGFIIDTAGASGRAEYRRLSMGNYLKKPAAFQKTVNDLPKGPTYYFKAFAVDDNNIEATGSEKSFTLAVFTLGNFTPYSGSMYDEIVLYGSNFGSIAENITVKFGEETAEVLFAYEDSIRVVVPHPDLSTNKLRTISVSIANTTKEFTKQFTYQSWNEMPEKINFTFSEGRSILINNIVYGFSLMGYGISFYNFDDINMEWKDYWSNVNPDALKYFVILNNYLYCIVGVSGIETEFQKYDLESKSYTSLRSISDSILFKNLNYSMDNSLNQLFSLGNYIYQAFTVYWSEAQWGNIETHELWRYDITANTWLKRNDMPDPGMIFTLNNQAYLLNNEHMYQYNAAADEWNDLNISTLPQINDSTYWTQYNFTYNNMNYLFNCQSQEIWKFNPATNTWSFVENIPVAMISPLMYQKDNMFFIEELSSNTDYWNNAWLYFILE